VNLGELQTRAQSLRRRSTGAVDEATRGELEALRREAAQASTAVARLFDRELQGLFADVYGGKPPPPLAVTSAGPGVVAGFGGQKGATLQFHAQQRRQDSVKLAAEVAAGIPALKTTIPVPLAAEAQFPLLDAGERRRARRALETELRQAVPSGQPDLVAKLGALPGLGPKQKERVLDILAEVRLGFVRAGEAKGTGGAYYQDVNWKHTRLEVERILDVIAASGLNAHEAETALLASIVSDSVKTPGNFIVHNVHGAEAAVHLLARLAPPPSAELIEDVTRATLEHQIGPPGFMANVAMRSGLRAAGVDGALIDAICAKVARPFEPAHLTPDRSEIAFTEVEKQALAKIGVLAWTVPHAGSRHEKAARAVIDADSLVNYASPDGWAKLAALHGPDQPPFLQESRLITGLTSTAPEDASAQKSFLDARTVVSEASHALYDRGLERTQAALETVLGQLERWVSERPPGSVPRTADGKVPYLDGELDYQNAAHVDFARELRAEAVRLLRDQERP
jgi:hypothetical protein